MKYAVILCDGMGDLPIEQLHGKTPMQAAHKPYIDKLATKSVMGICTTIPDGLTPGSDVANLAVLGYNPKTCYSGRSPLEAANLGIELKDNQIAMRCNLVTLSDEDEYDNKTMLDYCGGDISTNEARQLINALEAEFGNEHHHFYSGFQYRHCLVAYDSSIELGFTPPHDIPNRVIGDYLSKQKSALPFIKLMKESYDVLKNHPVNLKREKQGKRPANSAWLWGEGGRPELGNFYDMFGVKASVVSAVDLIKGIGRLTGMNVAEVEGATGYIDTDFSGKANAAIDEYKRGADFVFVHVEAPDECGHRAEIDNKVKAIELIDEKVVSALFNYLEGCGDSFRILIMPDHYTPLSSQKHSSQPVPFMIYDSVSADAGDGGCGMTFTEQNAAKTGLCIDDCTKLMPYFITGELR